jgi:trimethyllysine dioxygenase
MLIEAYSLHFWLRDHCLCEACHHPITKQRLVDTFEVSHV